MTLQDTQAKVPVAQTKIPSPPSGTATPAPPPPANAGSTGLEQILKRPRPMSAINELGRLLRPNRADASSPRPATPPRSEDVPPPSNPSPSRRDASPPQQLNIPGGASASLPANPGSSRPLVRSPQSGPNVTPLSNIGMLRDFIYQGFISCSILPSQ
jgi:hypothetical protein